MKSNHKSNFIKELHSAAILWPIWLRIGSRDLRLRYKRTSIGISWIFFNLAFTILAIGLIYSHLLKQDLAEFIPFLTAGLICWAHLTSAIVEGGNAFVMSEGYIKQISLPLFVYIFRFYVLITLTFLINLPVYFVIAAFYRISIHTGILWILPGLCMMSAVSFLLIAVFSHLNARFRDTSHLAGLLLQIMFYVTPIIWPAELIRNTRMAWIVDGNPFYHLIEIVRRPLIYSTPASAASYCFVLVLICVLFVAAWFVTKRYSQRIAYLL